MSTPPTLPEKILARVLRVAELEGKSVVVIAAVSAVVSLIGRPDWFGEFVSLLAIGCGATELHGVRLLRGGQKRGIDWLVRAELLLMGTVIFYAVVRFITTTPASVHASMSESAALFGQLGMDLKDMERTTLDAFRLTYVAVMLVTMIFQGGLALYYHRRRAAVAAALAQRPANNPLLTACPVCKKTVSRTAPMCPHCGHPLAPTAAM